MVALRVVKLVLVENEPTAGDRGLINSVGVS
jgi:hypothetical protein